MLKDKIVTRAIIKVRFCQVLLKDIREQAVEFFTGQGAYGVELLKRIRGNVIPFFTAQGFRDIELIVYAVIRFKHNIPLVGHDIPK